MRRRTYLIAGGSLGAALVGGSTASGRSFTRRPTGFGRGQGDGPIEVRITDANGPVRGGDLLEAEVEVTNAGETAVRPEIDYVVDGDHKVSVETTVEAGETTSLHRFQERAYPAPEGDETTIRVETAGDADERTIAVRGVDDMATERVAPAETVAVRPDASVLFEVDSPFADDDGRETHWFVDREYEGRSMGPWYHAYYGHAGVDHWQHSFEGEGTYEVTACVIGDAENRRASWTVEVTPDGPAAPAVDGAQPAAGTLELARDETASLDLDVVDADGDLERTVWWLGHSDVVLGADDVSGAADTATLELDGGCHGCPILAWVIDEDNRVAAARPWEIAQPTDEPDEPLENRLVVFSYSSDHAGTYEFAVDGEVERATDAGSVPFDHRAVTADDDAVDGGHVSGGVAGGGDAYRFSGDLESFSLERGGDHVFAYLNGAPLDDWTAANRPTHLAILGGGNGDVATYDFAATGSVAQSERAHGAPFADDVVTDDPEDEIRGGAVTGATAGGVDAYYFSGDLARFRIDDCGDESVRVWIDGSEVDPCELG